jgi:NADH dehydrogenase FAD-containing subunit
MARTKIVIIGGGFAAVKCARTLPKRLPGEECQIVVYSRENHMVFHPLLADVAGASTREAKGTPTDEKQDLLRAMLIFATAGLDSMVKQLITDALPSVIEIDLGATAMFKKYVERRLEKQRPP